MDSEHPDKGPSPGQDKAWIRGDLSRPVTIPDHELIRCIGQGSYGAVWLARNMMGVFRAIKIVFRNSFRDARPFERELSGIRKFEPISRSHEGFIDVLHVGINEAEGYFYYIMELGDDEAPSGQLDPQVYAPKTLAREISFRRRLPVKDCLTLGLALSAALAELHRHGLVHRDIKPSNIIFVNGIPKLADIGLVADANEARSYVGTEGFIPPEGPGTPRSDIYSLGKVLYEASTGRDRQDFPELPTNWDDPQEHAQLVELNEIVLQAWKSEAAERYASARDMHARLLVLENGQSVKRLRDLERLFSNLKRLTGAFAVVLALGGAVGYHFYREHQFAVGNRQRQLGANLANGSRAIDSSDYLAALPYFMDVLGLDQADPGRAANDRLRLGSIRTQSPGLVQMIFASGEITRIAFSPDQTRLLVAERRGQAQICDPVSGDLLTRPFRNSAWVNGAAFSPDATLVGIAGDNGCHLSRASDGALVMSLPHPASVGCVAFSPDGRYVATGCGDGLARVWDLATTNVVATFNQHTAKINAIAFSRGGNRLATGGADNQAWVWEPLTGKPLFGPLAHVKWVHDLSFNRDGSSLVTASADNKAHVWDLSSPGAREVLPTLNHNDCVFSAQYSPDGRWILTGSLDGTARLWLADTHQPISPNSVLRQSDRVIYAAFAPDGHRVLTCCIDGTARIWDLAATATEPGPFPAYFNADCTRFLLFTNRVAQLFASATSQPLAKAFTVDRPGARLVFDPAGRFLTTIVNSSNPPSSVVETWDVTSGMLAGPPLTFTNPVTLCVLDGDHQACIVTGSQAQLWDLVKGRPLSSWLPHPDSIEAASFSPDHGRLAIRGPTWLKVWNTASGSELFPMIRDGYSLGDAQFSPDGLLLATGAWDGGFSKPPAHIWNAMTGKLVAQLQHKDGILSVRFSPDSKRVVTASEDFTAMIWDARTGRPLTSPMRHLNQVLSARFSANGKWVVTASLDKTARVWDAETGDPLTPPFPHLHPLNSAGLLPGNLRLFTRDDQGKTSLWNLPTEDESLGEIDRLSRLLSGDSVTPSGRQPQKAPESIPELWVGLKKAHPSLFRVSRAEIAAWHDFAAHECELNQQMEAAIFHLERLLELRPDDPQITNRLTAARNGHLARQ